MSSVPPSGDTDQRLSYLLPSFINLSLPNTRSTSEVWVRTNGDQQVAISAGYGVGPHAGKGFIPYGKYARAALLFICTEAVRTGNPVISISETYRGFMKQLGLPWNRESAAEAVRQMQALAACTITLTTSGISDAGDTEVDIDRFVISFRDHMVFSATGELSGNTPSSIELSPQFMKVLAENGRVPIRTDAWLHLVQHFNSAMTLDIYTWLAYRLYNLKHPSYISWEQLYQQFGSQSAMKVFKVRFRQALASAMSVYPEAHVSEFGSGRRGGSQGLVLKMSKNAMDSAWSAL